jgi:hypothetical protein
MSNTAQVAYNPDDSVQQSFLSALALGESGSNGGLFLGNGGADLSSNSTDSYGFPIPTGSQPSSAAGLFQFTQGTWDQVASAFGLNFSSASDQEEGAWDYAQQVYSQNTGGQSLETALQNGNYSSVQSALASVWPSVTGNGASPQGLAYDLSNNVGATLPNVTSSASTSNSSASSGTTTGIVGTIQSYFVRFGLIIVGSLVILVALWQLLSNTGAVASPGETAKAFGKVVAEI